MARRCPTCEETKEDSSFYRHKGRSTGYASKCKECHIKQMATLYTKEEISLKNRKQNLKNKYGMTLEDYYAMLEDQDHSCLICQEYVELVVDHDHETGAVRGLLCRNCNSGLGMFRDNPEYLERAKEYVSSQN